MEQIPNDETSQQSTFRIFQYVNGTMTNDSQKQTLKLFLQNRRQDNKNKKPLLQNWRQNNTN